MQIPQGPMSWITTTSNFRFPITRSRVSGLYGVLQLYVFTTLFVTQSWLNNLTGTRGYNFNYRDIRYAFNFSLTLRKEVISTLDIRYGKLYSVIYRARSNSRWIFFCKYALFKIISMTSHPSEAWDWVCVWCSYGFFHSELICCYLGQSYAYPVTCEIILKVNPSPPSAGYMRKWSGPALVETMACRLFGAKPLPGPMLPSCLLDPDTPVTPAKPTRNRQKNPQNFQWIGQLSAIDNVAEDTVKPVGFMSGKIQYAIARFETDR